MLLRSDTLRSPESMDLKCNAVKIQAQCTDLTVNATWHGISKKVSGNKTGIKEATQFMAVFTPHCSVLLTLALTKPSNYSGFESIQLLGLFHVCCVLQSTSRQRVSFLPNTTKENYKYPLGYSNVNLYVRSIHPSFYWWGSKPKTWQSSKRDESSKRCNKTLVCAIFASSSTWHKAIIKNLAPLVLTVILCHNAKPKVLVQYMKQVANTKMHWGILDKPHLSTLYDKVKRENNFEIFRLWSSTDELMSSTTDNYTTLQAIHIQGLGDYKSGATNKSVQWCIHRSFSRSVGPWEWARLGNMQGICYEY